MRTPKLVKALLLSAALFAVASPAYASVSQPRIISKHLTATFLVQPPIFTLQWTDPQGENPTNSISEQTVEQDETIQLYLKASSNQEHYYRIKYVITRTDGTAIQDADVTLTENLDERSGNLDDDGQLVIYANSGHILADGTDSVQISVKFNTAGKYAIAATALEHNT